MNEMTRAKTIRLDDEDWAALERIIARTATLKNASDGVRHAIHFTDHIEASADRAERAS